MRKRARFRPMKHTLSGRDEQTMMKLVVDRGSDRVLGAHMVGADAPEIIQGLADRAEVRRHQGAARCDGGHPPDGRRRVRDDARPRARTRRPTQRSEALVES
jgi:hypothetical protein